MRLDDAWGHASYNERKDDDDDEDEEEEALIDPLFVEAMVHDERGGFWRSRIMGRRVRPFSLWHEVLLQSIGSPFLSGERVMPIDLARTVRICGARFPECAVKASFSFQAFWCCLGRGFARELEKFRAYREDYLSFPEYNICEDSGIKPGEMPQAPAAPLGPPPEPLRVFSEIVAWTKWSREVVWNLPSGEARWYLAMALKAQKVRVSFVLPEARADQEAFASADPEMHAALVRAAETWREV